MEGRYSVSRFRLLTGSLEAVQLQVQSLQVSHYSFHSHHCIDINGPFFIFLHFGVSEFLNPATEMYMHAHEKRLCCYEGFAGGTGEAGKQSEEVWCGHPPAAKGVSPLSVRFSQQCAEGHQCEVMLWKFYQHFHKLPKTFLTHSLNCWDAEVYSHLYAIAPRWAGLLEEIGERLSCSKALLQLWQRYKELYEQSCRSVQLQEEKADKLLKFACSKDIADEEVSDWIQECSVSVVFGKVWLVYLLCPSAEC